ncbi:hypothetical protein RRG08_007606 [Elysia crispata]|uniref:Uncharacterized protein n=1 Tax=Elysia crispata TaxID=231223 RepID=A0AAE1AII3_9GAST|nr:hypothetical protein RRG08_007606 [Elysia crispata]
MAVSVAAATRECWQRAQLVLELQVLEDKERKSNAILASRENIAIPLSLINMAGIAGLWQTSPLIDSRWFSFTSVCPIVRRRKKAIVTSIYSWHSTSTPTKNKKPPRGVGSVRTEYRYTTEFCSEYRYTTEFCTEYRYTTEFCMEYRYTTEFCSEYRYTTEFC